MHSVSSKRSTGTGAIDETVNVQGYASLLELLANFDSAPSSAAALTVSIENSQGDAFVVHSVDPSSPGMTDLNTVQEHVLAQGDKVKVAYSNPDGRTWKLDVRTGLG